VKEKPILFSAPMVRAILEGRKTQTRRICKAEDPNLHGAVSKNIYCPYGKSGDRLWVRETWCPVNDEQYGGDRWVDYRATPKYSAEHPAGWENAPDDAEALKWRPSIFMPRWASRITLEVTGVRVERLQTITEADARAEGVERTDELTGTADDILSLRHAYSLLWEQINGAGSWESNPFVWCISFSVVKS
jgi:hypothetical protein